VKVINPGYEHHIEAKLVAYNQVGDLNVHSIGWSHSVDSIQSVVLT